MTKTRGERLRIARERLFKSARVAAKALDIAFSTYWQHERAELPGGREYGPNEANLYAMRFRVTPEWLLTGRGKGIGVTDPIVPPDALKVPVVGYVGAGAEVHFYALVRGELDEVDLPKGAPESTVAVEIRGESLGSIFNRWLVYYDSVHRPVTPELIGELCVVGLEDGRILVKQIQRGRSNGLFNLVSLTDKPIEDVPVEWAAKINNISPRPVGGASMRT